MWVFASRGYIGIFRVGYKNRVKFGLAADLGDSAVGMRMVLAWSLCMPSQSPPLKVLKARQPLGVAPRGHGVAGGDGTPTPTGAAPSGMIRVPPTVNRASTGLRARMVTVSEAFFTAVVII
jgi:hypothetical protein